MFDLLFSLIMTDKGPSKKTAMNAATKTANKAIKTLWKSRNLKAFYQECAASNIRPFLLLADEPGGQAAPQVAAHKITLMEAKMLVGQLRPGRHPSIDNRPMDIPPMPRPYDELCLPEHKNEFERYVNLLRRYMCPGRYHWGKNDMPMWHQKFEISRYSATAKVM